MKSTRREKANELGSGPPDARDHDAGHLDGRNVNTLRIDDDDDEPNAEGRDRPTPAEEIPVRPSAHVPDPVYTRRCSGVNGGKSQPLPDPTEVVDPDAPPDPKFQTIAERLQHHPGLERLLAPLADLIGVHAHTLRGLGVVWSDKYGTWGIPFRDHVGRVVGVTFWHAQGFRSHIRGGTRGLLLPERPAEHGTLYVCEGVPDTAVMLAAGRRAIGRSNMRISPLARAWLAKYLTAVPADTPVVIVGYRDDDGRDDASSLADWLADECGREVRWALPRSEFKDVREQWRATGSVGLKLQTGTGR